jgi:hypothetical protein
MNSVFRQPFGWGTPSSHDLVSSFGLDYYFDKGRITGIGCTHVIGDDPKVNFANQGQDIVALKLKL